MADDPLVDLFLRTGGSAEGRAAAIRRFAFAVPGPAALDAIGSWAPSGIVEIGAGTGYWAGLLAARGVEVVAYDKAPAATGSNQWFTGREDWFPVREGDEEVVATEPSPPRPGRDDRGDGAERRPVHESFIVGAGS